MRGWMVNRRVLPAGTDVKYEAVTLDVFPYLQEEFERLGKVRDLARRELIVLEESVTPSRHP